MDARAMDDHDSDDCGLYVARLFEADELKYQAIRDAWWDLDDEEQEDVHAFMCENRRSPEHLQSAQQFEKLAAEYEETYRERAKEDQEKADRLRKAAMEKAAQNLAQMTEARKRNEAAAGGVGIGEARVKLMEGIQPNSYFINTPNPVASNHITVTSRGTEAAW